MEQQLQELLDRKACEDVLMRYGRTLDWLDQAGQDSCFWPDAHIDYGFFKGSGKDWVPTVMTIEATAPRRWHLTSGIMVEVAGNTAKGECYGLTVSATENEQGELTDTMFGGRYLDELEKRDGEWRISRRRYVADWVHQFPDGLQALAASGLDLNTLKIESAGHPQYREL
jgi:hypothetical protein